MRNGDIVCPGGYGSRVLEAGEAGPHWEREQVLEHVRRRRFPAKPSRLDACFATGAIETAMFYHQQHCSEGMLYHVAFVAPLQPSHIGDFNVVQPLPRSDKTMEEIADSYWAHDMHTNIEGYPGLVCDEFVIASALRILGRVFF